MNSTLVFALSIGICAGAGLLLSVYDLARRRRNPPDSPDEPMNLRDW
jgi:hypothetical protein